MRWPYHFDGHSKAATVLAQFEGSEQIPDPIPDEVQKKAYKLNSGCGRDEALTSPLDKHAFAVFQQVVEPRRADVPRDKEHQRMKPPILH